MWFQSILLSSLSMMGDQARTQIPVYVFAPNPILSSGSKYGESIRDHGDDTNEELRLEMVQVDMLVDMHDDVVYLSDSFLQLVNLSSPNERVDGFQRGNIRADRSLSSFESVSCVYHIRRFQSYLRSLGFGHLIKPIRIDPKALGGSDHSRYNSAKDPPTIEFGVGGVDDAEDAQVVIHEYMHAMLNEALAADRKNSAAISFEEAVCDHFCLRYSEEITGKTDDRVFSWDGHNEFWDGYTVRWHDLEIADPACDETCQREKWLFLLRKLEGNLPSDLLDRSLLIFFSSQSIGTSHEQIAKQFAAHIESGLQLVLRPILIQHGFLKPETEGQIRKLYANGDVLHLKDLELFEAADLLHINGSPIQRLELDGSPFLPLPIDKTGHYLLRLTNETQFPKKEEWYYLIVL